jgi:dihydropteroate synthase
MGVLNVTPDSFSDGGRYDSVDAAVVRAKQMIDEGADVVDVGGESTRPGADETPADVQIERTAPVVERIAPLGVPISIDTRKAVVAKAALDSGATIVNDVSGGVFDVAMLPLIADRRVPIVLMHMRGTPQTMETRTAYDGVVADVRRELAERVAAAKHAGAEESAILVDPGLGFAKTAEQSLELVRRIGELTSLGPVVIGASRKRFVGHVLGTDVDERLEGSLAVAAWCASHGVAVVRAHDVRATRRVVDMIGALA